MPTSLTLVDRLRIERVVWLLDQRLYDLPRRSRIANRREVRENLLTAARDLGTGPALRRLGDGRQLATDYLTAEFGEGPRHSWMAAGVFAATTALLLNWVLFEAVLAFRDGLLAASPHATGSFEWGGLALVQSAVTFRLVDGRASWVGGAWTPWLYLFWVTASVVAGRLWRALPWRALPWLARRRAAAAG